MLTKERRVLLLVSLSFVLIRLLYLQQYTQENPFYNHPILDSAFYLQWADAIRAGKTMFPEEYHHPPGYAFFLAALLAVSGGNFYAVLLLQSLMLALQGLLLFAIARRIAGRAAAWFSFALFCLCGPLVFYSMKLLSETLFTTLLLLCFYWLLRFLQEGRARDLFLSGLALGATIEVRGTAIVYLIPAMIVLLSKKYTSPQPKVKTAMLWLAGVAVLVLPVLVRNVAVSGHWTPVAANWGENFYMANNPNAAGTFSSIPGVRTNLNDQIEDIKAEASRRAGRQLNSQEAQRYWFHEGLKFITRDPGGWLALMGRKAQRIFSRREASTMYFYDLETKYFQPSLKFLFINMAWILPLSFLGTACAPSNTESRLLFGFLLAHLFLLLIFWPELRFVLPAIPFLLISAGFITRLHVNQSIVGVALAALVLYQLVNLNSLPGTGGREAWFTNASSAYYANGQFDDSIAMAKSAIQMNPNYADAWVDLGAALYAKGDKEQARKAWNTALKIEPGHVIARENLEKTNR